jgi:AraC-like DNA-binding protein
VVDGKLVCGERILNLRESLLALKTPQQRFLFAEKDFLKIYRDKLYENPFTDYAVSKILQTPNLVSIKDISKKTGYSQKHFINVFKRHVGLTPKEFMKVIRFQKAITEVEKKKGFNWANVAYECGYYDQSHFIADFRTFSGFTPQQFIKRDVSFKNYVAIQ